MTENITLTIGHETFYRALVDFDYEPEEYETDISPPASSQVHIYRVQLPTDIGDGEIWADLNRDHFHLIENQVLDFIEEQNEEAKLTRAIDNLENRKELD